MNMTQIPFGTTDWAGVAPVEYKGDKGDHWRVKGHVVLCLEGELHTELSDGRTFVLRPGMSYQVADNAAFQSRLTEGSA